MRFRFNHLAAVSACLLATGCLYLDTVNLPPSATLALVSDGPYWRGDRVQLTADDTVDADGQLQSIEWQVRACDGDLKCEPVTVLEFGEGDVPKSISFDIPLDVVPGVPTEIVEVDMRAFDQLGAFDSQSIRVDVGNRAPTIELQLQATPDGNKVGGTFPFAGADNPALVIAQVTDSDDPERAPALGWELVGVPPGSVFDDVVLEPYVSAVDPAYQLTPDVAGLYTVRVTATDGLGDASTQDVDVVFTAETPPCIALTSPEAQTLIPYTVAGDGNTTLSVVQVDDELDPFPGTALGVTEFAWAVEAADGSGFIDTGAVGASFTIEGSEYAPGDEVRVRVEAFDRQAAPVTCDDSDDTCSAAGDECVQRVTWMVRVL